ncbi:MAG: hypothetical protein WCV80_00715 [Candidatus Paceibacterota bacterium]|jgi:hypothetical protein
MLKSNNLIFILLKKVIVALLILVATTTGVIIIRNQITKIGTSLIETKRSAFFFERRSEVVNTLRTQFARVGDADTKVLNAYIPDDNIVEFIGLLNSVAAQNSIQITSQFGTPVTQLTLQEGTILSSIDFSANLTGTFASYINFMKHFESLPYFTTIRSFRILSPTAQGIGESISVALQGKVYARGKAQ